MLFQDISRTSTVTDINGRSATALLIFSMVIGFLRDHLLDTIRSQAVGVSDSDIQYVITVPAIWDDKAKQFMSEAALKVLLFIFARWQGCYSLHKYNKTYIN